MANLHLQADLIRREIEALKARYPELEEDDELLADMLEGETDLHAVLSKLVIQDRDARTFSDALKSQREALDTRRSRFDRQSEMVRSLIHKLLDAAGTDKVLLPEATIGKRRVPPSVQIINEDHLPKNYWINKPVIDKRLIAEKLKEGNEIPGAAMSNGGETISIRYT